MRDGEFKIKRAEAMNIGEQKLASKLAKHMTPLYHWC